MHDEIRRQTATATKSSLALSVTSIFGLDKRRDLGVRNARRDLLSRAARPPAASL